MELNLPQYKHNIRKRDEQLEIFCFIRGNWYVLTPEEWVRQNVAQHFVEALHYSKSRIVFEFEIDVLGKKMRADIVVYNENFRIEGIVECKAPFVEIDQSVLDQIGRYNRVLEAKWVGVTNGKQHAFNQLNQGWNGFWPEA